MIILALLVIIKKLGVDKMLFAQAGFYALKSKYNLCMENFEYFSLFEARNIGLSSFDVGEIPRKTNRNCLYVTHQTSSNKNFDPHTAPTHFIN